MSLGKFNDVAFDSHSEFSMEEVCSSTWRDLYKFIYYKVQNKEEAEDITQETYMRAIDYIEREKPYVDNYLGYLKVIALNIIRDKWRKEKRVGKVIHIDRDDLELVETEDFSDATIDRTWIEEGLKNLSFEQRRIIELRIIKGFTVAETARIMKKREGTIRVIQFRALKILAKIFRNQGL